MSEFAKMDLFFFITSVATAILTILLVVVLVYLIRFLRDLKHISNNLKQVISFFNNIFKRYKKGK